MVKKCFIEVPKGEVISAYINMPDLLPTLLIDQVIMKFARRWALSILLLASAISASLLDDILKASEEAVTCAACRALFVPLKVLAELGDAAFVDTITTVCTTLKVSQKGHVF